MDKLITVIPPDKVTEAYKLEAKANWSKWDSKNKKSFAYNYTAEERVLILEGSADLTPADGSPVVTIGAGDAVTFHKGFKCKWRLTKRMKKYYTVLEELEDAPAIVCDVCGQGCVEESYFMVTEEQDICPKCYEMEKELYVGAEHQKEGEPWIEQKEVKRNPNNKKRKAA